MLDFLLAPANGIPAQSRNFNQALDTPVAPWQRQQANEAASVTLIQRCQNTIDRPMFFGDGAVGMVLTRRTRTGMNKWPASFFHWAHSLEMTRRLYNSIRAWEVSLSQNRQVIFGQGLS